MLVLAGIILLCGLVMWQMGVFNAGSERVVATDWVKLQPLQPSISYDHASGDFTASFTNTIGTSIKIDTLPTVTDQLDPTVVWSEPRINDVNPTANPQTVKAGSSLKLSVNDNGADRNPGDPFDLEIRITYTYVGGGISTSHVETGRIRGPVE